MGVLEPS